MKGGGDKLTLVIELAALRRLAQPATAVAEAREWCDHVGVTSDRPAAIVQDTLEEHNIDCDFISGSGSQSGSLAAVRQRFPSDRHVYVDADNGERRIAQALGWEHLSIEEAAEKADWTLVDDPEG